jgi:phosphoribosylanthranilate isomerase
MNFKVCGLDDLAFFDSLNQMRLDYAGCCFDEAKPDLGGLKFSADEMRCLEVEMLRVGTFCNQRNDFIEEIMDAYGLNLIQFNGQESAATCRKFSTRYEIIKRIPLDNNAVEKMQGQIEQYDADCDFFLFEVDMLHPLALLISILSKLHIEKPFFIGGNLQTSDASTLHQYHHPDFYGVDLGSCFMRPDAKPDTARILSFMRAVTQVDN